MPDSQEIFKIITEGEYGQLQELLAADNSLAVSRNEAGVSALMMAAYYRKLDVVQLLRENLDEIDIFEAAMLGDAGRVRELIKGRDLDSLVSADGFTPLHLAAFFNQSAVVKLLIEHGADVNPVAGNPSRVQPLHSAVACSSVEIVKLLLESGAEVNTGQSGGWTALQAAAKHGNHEMVELLLQHGADPEQAADDGSTAISMAENDAIKSILSGQ